MTFDDYCAAVREANVNYVLTCREEAHWDLKLISGNSLTVQFGSDGAASIVDGIARPDAFVFLYRHAYSAANIRLNGHVVDNHDIVRLAPGSHFIFSADGPRTWISVSLPLEALPVGYPLRQSAASGKTIGRSVVFKGAASRTGALVSSARHLQDAIVGGASAEVREIAEAALFAALVDVSEQAQPTDVHARGGQGDGAFEIVCRALKTLHSEELGDRWSVGDLAQATDVGPRTMLRAFKTTIGMGPVRYLRYRQLNLIRRELRAAAVEKSSVTGVMKSVGISEFGRAAGDYKRLFGEAPSETLHLAKSHPLLGPHAQILLT